MTTEPALMSQEISADRWISYVQNTLTRIDECDKVILAYWSYNGTIPMVVVTFREPYDWSRKIILPLCTNEGGVMSSSERDIKGYAKMATLGK